MRRSPISRTASACGGAVVGVEQGLRLGDAAAVRRTRRGNHIVKFGHFYTIMGYEVVPAIGNFFYTHAYTMQYGEPFTHTGILDTWTPNDQLVVYGGITNGWDNFSDPININGIGNLGYPGANSNAAFLGGITFKNSDQTQALTTTVSSGNEPASLGGEPQHRQSLDQHGLHQRAQRSG